MELSREDIKTYLKHIDVDSMPGGKKYRPMFAVSPLGFVILPIRNAIPVLRREAMNTFVVYSASEHDAIKSGLITSKAVKRPPVLLVLILDLHSF